MGMQKKVLVTGGLGFLGRAVARLFSAHGCSVVGLGHGKCTASAARSLGYTAWFEGELSSASLAELPGAFDVVVHCAASSSVAYSLDHPLKAFRSTVQGTAELLDHLRRTSPGALLLFPSSAAVYGAADDRPLVETDAPNPVSPYGFYKLMTEELLDCHARCHGIRVASVRFFSIYGPGLRKQLLWDAANRLLSGVSPAMFWGTGEETRDWIHVEDAASLLFALSTRTESRLIVNGASGERITVAAMLDMLRGALGVDTPFAFNGTIKPGDPRFYHADTTRLRGLGWTPAVTLSQGLAEYADWVKRASVTSAAAEASGH